MVGVAVVGVGYWGPNLVRNAAAVPGASLEWICDLRPERLERLRGSYPAARHTTDLEEVLASDNVGAVILATPAETHDEIGLEVLAAGKHLLVEKPLAMTVTGARALVDEAATRRLVLLVGHTFEYNAAVRKVRELIAGGEIGDLIYLHSQRVNLGQVRTGCNAMWSLAPHDISIANFLVGAPPVWVRAYGYRFLGQEHEDVVFLNIGYPDNRVAHIHVSWLDPNKVRRTTVVGSRKMVVYDEMSNDAKVRVYDKGVSRVMAPNGDAAAPPFGEFQFLTRSGDILIPRIDFTEPLGAEVRHFIACVEGREQPLTDGRSGLAAVQVLEAAQRSLDTGGTVVELDP